MKRQKTAKKSAADEQFARLRAHIPTSLEATYKPEEPAKKSQPRWKKIVKRTLLVIVLLVLLSGLYIGGKFVYNGVKLFGWDGFWSLFNPPELRGEASGRVNVLIAGNAGDQPGHGGADLTDSIMLLSINTRDNSGYILSIPRDLYVDIPDYGAAKINEAYPAGGMELLKRVVSERFGVAIHYDVLVNYTALEEAVDAVGGIDVVIDSADPRGLYDPSRDLRTGGPLIDLPNGPVKLDGHMALNLARARGQAAGSYGYARSDFTRTEHQRQILTALAEKARSLKTLANPLTMGQLFDTLGNNVQTDMSLGEVRRLYNIVNELDPSDFESVGLNDADGQNLLQSYTTPTRQSALIPRAGFDDFAEIRVYLRGLD